MPNPDAKFQGSWTVTSLALSTLQSSFTGTRTAASRRDPCVSARSLAAAACHQAGGLASAVASRTRRAWKKPLTWPPSAAPSDPARMHMFNMRNFLQVICNEVRAAEQSWACWTARYQHLQWTTRSNVSSVYVVWHARLKKDQVSVSQHA